MKITFIGTSAGEGYPGVWCKCPNCKKARELKGKNIRGSSCALIDDDLLIDMNAHFVDMAPQLDIDPTKITGILVTHPHMDHFAPEWLGKRGMAPALKELSIGEMQTKISPCFSKLPLLTVYGNEFVRDKLYSVPQIMERQEDYQVSYKQVIPRQKVTVNGLSFIPIESHHGGKKGFCYNYIVERNGTTLLYASDTGGYDDEMLDVILSYKYDCIIMEGTFGLGVSTDPNHMALEKNRKMLKLFEEHKVWKNGVNFHLTHICPHWTPVHDEYAPMLREEGIEVAYDGKVIEF